MILLGICFAIVFGLSRAQEDAGGSRTISIAISLTISIVNIMLGRTFCNILRGHQKIDCFREGLH